MSVMYAESIGCDYVVMNDVDQIPVSDKITHEWPKDPLHLCTNTDQHGFSFYDAVYKHARAHTHKHTHTQSHTHTHTHTQSHTHTHTYVCMYANLFACSCVCVYSDAHQYGMM